MQRAGVQPLVEELDATWHNGDLGAPGTALCRVLGLSCHRSPLLKGRRGPELWPPPFLGQSLLLPGTVTQKDAVGPVRPTAQDKGHRLPTCPEPGARGCSLPPTGFPSEDASFLPPGSSIPISRDPQGLELLKTLGK